MNIRLPRLLIIELIIIATGVIVYFAGGLLAQFASIALILAFAVLLTYALLPIVNFLDRSRWIPRGLAVLLVYLALFAAVAGFVALVSVPLAKQAEQLANDYPKYASQFKAEFPKLQDQLERRNIDLKLEERADEFTKNLESTAGNVVSRTGSILAGVFGTISTVFIVLFVTAYFLLSGKSIVSSMLAMAPRNRQRMLKKLFADYDRTLGNFVRGQLLISFIVALVVGIFSAAVGLPYFVLIGLVAGITSLVPVVGALLGMVLPVIIAAFVNPILIPVFIVFFVVFNEVTDKILYPRIVGRAVDLHPLLVFFGLLVAVQIAGVTGALLATPLLALLKVTAVSLHNTAGLKRV